MISSNQNAPAPYQGRQLTTESTQEEQADSRQQQAMTYFKFLLCVDDESASNIFMLTSDICDTSNLHH